jgi:hypothetical protein
VLIYLQTKEIFDRCAWWYIARTTKVDQNANPSKTPMKDHILGIESVSDKGDVR